MGRTAFANRARVEELKREYQLSEKQARYLDVDLREPALTTSEKARIAGYPEGSRVANGGARLRAPRIIKGKEAELAKMAKLEANRQALDANPQQFIESVFLKGVDDPEITANQIKSAENLGKLRGLYVERIEIDPGVALRSKYFTNLTNFANLSEEEED